MSKKKFISIAKIKSKFYFKFLIEGTIIKNILKIKTFKDKIIILNIGNLKNIFYFFTISKNFSLGYYLYFKKNNIYWFYSGKEEDINNFLIKKNLFKLYNNPDNNELKKSKGFELTYEKEYKIIFEQRNIVEYITQYKGYIFIIYDLENKLRLTIDNSMNNEYTLLHDTYYKVISKNRLIKLFNNNDFKKIQEEIENTGIDFDPDAH